MSFIWVLFVFVSSIWVLHDCCMNFIWCCMTCMISYEFYMSVIWFVYELHMSFIRLFYEFCISCIWVLYEIYMSSRWGVYKVFEFIFALSYLFLYHLLEVPRGLGRSRNVSERLWDILEVFCIDCLDKIWTKSYIF